MYTEAFVYLSCKRGNLEAIIFHRSAWLGYHRGCAFRLSDGPKCQMDIALRRPLTWLMVSPLYVYATFWSFFHMYMSSSLSHSLTLLFPFLMHSICWWDTRYRSSLLSLPKLWYRSKFFDYTTNIYKNSYFGKKLSLQEENYGPVLGYLN